MEQKAVKTRTASSESAALLQQPLLCVLTLAVSLAKGCVVLADADSSVPLIYGPLRASASVPQLFYAFSD